jgi:C4-dicarboxylate-specific signal transduction histidine kinase
VAKTDQERLAIVETKLDALEEKVDQHRQESQQAHTATQHKIDAQSLALARIEERLEQQAKADDRRDREQTEHAWTPAKVTGFVAALLTGVGTLAAALGYQATHPAPQVVPPTPAAIPRTDEGRAP